LKCVQDGGSNPPDSISLSQRICNPLKTANQVLVAAGHFPKS